MKHYNPLQNNINHFKFSQLSHHLKAHKREDISFSIETYFIVSIFGKEHTEHWNYKEDGSAAVLRWYCVFILLIICFKNNEILFLIPYLIITQQLGLQQT